MRSEDNKLQPTVAFESCDNLRRIRLDAEENKSNKGKQFKIKHKTIRSNEHLNERVFPSPPTV